MSLAPCQAPRNYSLLLSENFRSLDTLEEENKVLLRSSIIWDQTTDRFPSSKYAVYATAYVYRELYGKITDRQKIV